MPEIAESMQFIHQDAYLVETGESWEVHFGSPNSEFAIPNLTYFMAIEIVQRWNSYMPLVNRQPNEPYEYNIELRPDGNMWCATFHDLINIQESPAGFGPTPLEAIRDLAEQAQDIELPTYPEVILTSAHERLEMPVVYIKAKFGSNHFCEPAPEQLPLRDRLKVGTLVRYWKGAREGEPTGTGKIQYPCSIVGSQWVVWIEGCSGCVAVTHVEMVEDAKG